MASEIDVAWAAGLFEGEGSVGINRCKTAGGKGYIGAYFSLGMRDDDVLDRFHGIVGCGHIRKHSPGMRQWGTGKWDDVQRLAELFRPHLGVRRTQRINEVLAEMREYKSAPLGQRSKGA